MREVMRQRQPAVKEVTLFQPKERTVRLHGVPCAGGGPAGPVAIFVIQDVTEAHRYEQLRREFVANVSHELKSPLTSIRSLAETLLEGALSDSDNNRRFVQLIDEDAARLSRLIHDLLALSQIESQAVPLKLATVELAPLLDSVLASLQPSVVQRRLAVAVDLPPGLRIKVDPDRFRQVLFNLLDNAVKYNRDGGSIRISASQEGAWMTVRIADTGIGIPAQALPRIFERFYRVDKARSRDLGGTGLGLSIVKHIVEAHGGRVAVESRPGEGTCFSLAILASV